MIKKPLTIKGEPYQDEIKTFIGTYRKCTMLNTNYGPLTVKEAAKILEIYPGTLRKRLKLYGPQDPRTTMKGQLPQKDTPKPRGKKYVEKANAELMSLGIKTRQTNLIKMPNSGTWEKDNA